MVLGCAFLWIMHPPATLGPEGAPQTPAMHVEHMENWGKSFLNWDEYSPACLCLSLPPKRVQTLVDFFVHLSLRCDTEVAPRALHIEFRGFCLFWPSGKRFRGWFGTQLPLAKSWTENLCFYEDPEDATWDCPMGRRPGCLLQGFPSFFGVPWLVPRIWLCQGAKVHGRSIQRLLIPINNKLYSWNC